MTVRTLRTAARRLGTPRRVAMLSVHTSPLDQPGTGDAGGMNVYVAEVAARLAQLGTEVEVFTRATSSELPPLVEVAPGVLVRHVTAGPFEALAKDRLPGQLCAFTAALLRAEPAREPGSYDLVHSHYWLSGQAALLARALCRVPLVHSMHTMAKVKNAALVEGDTAEPLTRVIGEQHVVDAADRLVANTDDEAQALVGRYGADPDRVDVVHPGVDLDRFAPGDQRLARAALQIPADALLLLFAGRIQPLKAPDVLIRSVAELVRGDPGLRSRLVGAVVGGPSGSGYEHTEHLERLATELGVADLVRFAPPVEQDVLARWYQAADLTVVPSHSESFGLVALESQACATPVVAAGVGGLRTAVADGRSGVLVDGNDPAVWAGVLGDLLADPVRRESLARRARNHAAGFGWDATARGLQAVYRAAMAERLVTSAVAG